MADSLSAIQEFVKPQVGGSAGTWGTKLNTDIESMDGLISVPRIQRQVLSDGSVTMVVSAGTVAKITITQNTTIAFSGFAADTTPFKPSQRVLLQITGNGTNTVGFTGVTWLSGVAPVLTAAIVHYIEIFTVDNGTTKYGVHHGVIDAIPDGFIVAADIADGTITGVKLLDGTLDGSELGARAVTYPKIATVIAALTHSTTQVNGFGASTPLTFDTEVYDPQGCHIPGNPTRLTVQTGQAGVYRIYGVANYDGNSGDNSQIRLAVRKNGSTVLRQNSQWTEIEGSPQGIFIETIDPNAAENDYYELVISNDDLPVTVRSDAELEFGFERKA